SQGAFGQYGRMMFQYNQMPVQPVIRSGPSRPSDTVQMMLLAEKATQLGYVVTDEEISGHLFDLVDQKLDEKQISDALVGTGRRISMRQIFGMLREEMLAHKLYQDLYRGWQAPPAGRLLDYYSRLNRQIQLDLVAVPVEQFIDQVSDPTEAELTDYFDEYKTVVKLSDVVNGQEFASPKPGFKLPHRVAIEYVIGSSDELLDEVRDEITEEDIQRYYDENKTNDELLHAEGDLHLADVEEASGDNDDDAKAIAQEPADDAVTKSAEPDGEGSTEKKEKIEFKPLEEVRDHIHQQLAQQRAKERLEEKFQQIRSKMNAYHEARLFAEVDEEPTYRRPNIQAAAKTAGLKYEKTGLLSAEAYAASKKLKIGGSVQAGEITTADRYPDEVGFHQLAFQEGEQSLFKPEQMRDDEQVYYLFWKIKEESETVPKLADIREEVLRAWKLGAGRTDETGAARGYAREWAEKAAADVAGGKELAAVAKERGTEVHETDLFSWVSAGTAPGANQMNAPLRLGTVGGVEVDGKDIMREAGPDFMKVVYGMQVGDVSVAANHPKTYIYVTKLINENKSPVTLQENFFDDIGNRDVIQQLDQVAALEWQTLQQKWWSELESEFDLVWLKPEMRYQQN
ncbi:MAG TPA: hypothetical protein VMX74_00990, partial [Pirellulales bacterium]|nr:hypothetical protein [Pirellulales bacterium]